MARERQACEKSQSQRNTLYKFLKIKGGCHVTDTECRLFFFAHSKVFNHGEYNFGVLYPN